MDRSQSGPLLRTRQRSILASEGEAESRGVAGYHVEVPGYIKGRLGDGEGYEIGFRPIAELHLHQVIDTTGEDWAFIRYQPKMSGKGLGYYWNMTRGHCRRRLVIGDEMSGTVES